MKKKKLKNRKPADGENPDKKGEVAIILAIALFALLGLAFGYYMFREFSGIQ